MEEEQCCTAWLYYLHTLVRKSTQNYAVLYACACSVLRMEMLQDCKELLSQLDNLVNILISVARKLPIIDFVNRTVALSQTEN